MKKYRFALLPLLLLFAPAVSAQDSAIAATGKEIRISPAAWYDTPKVGPLQYNYYHSLGAACKAELKLEKATRVPFRFRLGSLAQTDYMEQKPNAPKPEQH